MTQVKPHFFSFCLYYLVIFLLPISVFSIQSKTQDKSINLQDVKKAEEIIDLSRKAVKGKNESAEFTGLSTVFSLESHALDTLKGKEPKTSESSGEIKLDLSFPDKAKFSKSEEYKVEDNRIFYNFVLNGNKYDSESYNIFNGQRLDTSIEQTEEQKSQATLEAKKQVFLEVFPILLEATDYASLEFSYIGKAEANSEKADVLEASLPDESKIRLFFDEKSHLLKMLTNIGKTRFGAEYEEKRFFSDYKEKEGFMVANKINVEKTSLTKAGKFEENDELTIKSAKFNPDFRPSFFEMK